MLFMRFFTAWTTTRLPLAKSETHANFASSASSLSGHKLFLPKKIKIQSLATALDGSSIFPDKRSTGYCVCLQEDRLEEYEFLSKGDGF